MRNQCVNALYLLCKINRSRQEEAAVAGVLSPLKEIISQVASQLGVVVVVVVALAVVVINSRRSSRR